MLDTFCISIFLPQFSLFFLLLIEWNLSTCLWWIGGRVLEAISRLIVKNHLNLNQECFDMLSIHDTTKECIQKKICMKNENLLDSSWNKWQWNKKKKEFFIMNKDEVAAFYLWERKKIWAARWRKTKKKSFARGWGVTYWKGLIFFPLPWICEFFMTFLLILKKGRLWVESLFYGNLNFYR